MLSLHHSLRYGEEVARRLERVLVAVDELHDKTGLPVSFFPSPTSSEHWNEPAGHDAPRGDVSRGSISLPQEQQLVLS